MTAVTAIDHLTGASSKLHLPDDMTIDEMLDASNIKQRFRISGEVYIREPVSGREAYINREFWDRVRPKAGCELILRDHGGKGGGGGGKSILGIVLSIAMMAAAAWAGATLAASPALIEALGAGGAQILGGLASATIGIPGRYYKGATAP